MSELSRIIDSMELILDGLRDVPGRTAKVLCCELSLAIPLLKIQAELRDGECLSAAIAFSKVLLEGIPGHLERDTCEVSHE